MNDIILSIIIVNYKVKDLLAQTIRSLVSADDFDKCEVIVIDNNSRDGSKELIKTDFSFVKYIELRTNMGFGKACNAAAKKARGKFLLMLNPDTIISKNTLSFGMNYLSKMPEVGILGPKILNQDGSFQFQCRRSFPTPLNAFAYMTGISKIMPKSKVFGAYNLTYLPIDEECNPDAVSGACFFIPKSLYLKVNGFDEQFFMYGEDLDLCAKVKQAGYLVKYSPETEIIHFKGRSSTQKKIKSRLDFYRAMILFSKKYKSSYGSFFPNWLLSIGIFLLGGINIFSIIIKNSPVFLTDLFFANIFLPLSAIAYAVVGEKQFVYETQLKYVLISHIIISFAFMTSLFVSNHYKSPKPSKKKTAQMSIAAVLFVFATYYLVHQEVAYSRVIIFSAVFMSAFSIVGWRTLVSPLSHFYKKYFSGYGRVVLLAEESNSDKIQSKLDSEPNTTVVFVVSTKNLSELSHIKEKYSPDTLVICAKTDWYSSIIRELSEGRLKNIEIFWLPPESHLTDALKLKHFMIN
jgi:GT2 family glycosyltransferase